MSISSIMATTGDERVKIGILAVVALIAAILVVAAILVGVYAKRVTVSVKRVTDKAGSVADKVGQLANTANTAAIAHGGASGLAKGVTEGLGNLVQRGQDAAAAKAAT